jgi:transcriptional regulator with XRE-family HTH domain
MRHRTVGLGYSPVISISDTSAGWRAETVGRQIRDRREQLGWTQSQLAEHVTERYGIHTTPMDVSRRERGVRALTVDALFAYALALGCSIMDLLIEDDGYTWITPLRDPPPRRRAPKFLERGLTAIALRPGELRLWLTTGRWWPDGD